MRLDVDAVLFDLDGTLIDSAPDLAAAANLLRTAAGLDPLPFAALRPMVGAGARGMLKAALDIGPDHADFPALRDTFLLTYEARMTALTKPFDGVRDVLSALESAGTRWGIVTNKAARFTEPLVPALGLQNAAVVVCGDTTPYSKPHPQPLLEAAHRLALAPNRCVYVGDDLRDVQAGRAAGMPTVVAAWGYLGAGEPVVQWGADHVIAEPAELLKLLAMA